MIRGLEAFTNAFRECCDSYVLIGGVACTLIMETLSIPFRATKDLDIVLCIENMNADFGNIFWEFIRNGEYAIQEIENGKKCFYRFSKPKRESWPFQLELFSRLPDSMILTKNNNLTPIPLNDTVSSLSAILLDEDYYSFIRQNKNIVNGLSVASAECLIVLKAKAFIDLQNRKLMGEQQVDSRNIKKHKNDIVRLFASLPINKRVQLPEKLRLDMRIFAERMDQEDIDVKALNLPFSSSYFNDGIRQIFTL
ncbi:MAG: hypothetical protein Q4G69_12150 [Planctomycetia bacterium]|nr:hypothetical protein [Planctomycetia bacterium]